MTDRPRPDESEEAAFARRLADGDAAAWEAFVDGWGPRLAGMVRRMMWRRAGQAPAADVDEVVAEVFLTLLRDDARLLRAYDPAFPLATWLAVVARTALHRRLRRRRPPAAGDAVEGAPAAASVPAEEAARREEALVLRRALGGLGDRDRLLLRLRFVEGLDYAAIALALGVEPSSVGPLLARAKGRLRARLEGGPEEAGPKGPVRSAPPGG